MKKSLKNIFASPLHVMMIIFTLLFVSGCGGSDVEPGEVLLTCDLPLIPNTAGTQCVEPPALACPAPTVPNETNDACVVGADPNAPEPTVFPGDNQAILFYNRIQDGTSDPAAYEGWRLHTWSNAACDSYADPDTEWANGRVINGVDPNYGAYWILDLKEGYADCANFIIHIGTEDEGKEMGGADFRMNLVQDDPVFQRMNFTISGIPSVFEFPITSLGDLPLQITDYAAHWINANTLVWDIGSEAETLGVMSYKLHFSADATIEADEDDNLTGTSLDLTAGDLSPELAALYPQFDGWVALTGDWTADDAKGVLKNQLALAAYDSEKAVKATWVQYAKVLDDIYTSGEADADEATLGPIYNEDGSITANLWAPTAQSVSLNVYNADKTVADTIAMTEDAATGIWSHTGDASLDRMFYQYELTVYHHQNNAIEVVTSTDPYSVSLSTNGVYSQFVNLADEDLKPTGWDGHTVPVINDPEDAVIYEGHVRDFSARDMSTTEANRGKYLAFTETGTAPVNHLSNLAMYGVTHFHLLPTNDIATINEDPSRIVDINDTVGDLCAVNEDAPVCGVESDSATLLSVFESYDTFGSDAQALAQSMRGTDSFNWGYDPKHFNVPDGIYATDADGPARILEKRAMTMALHDMGLRVVMDVVFNHVNSAGLFENSVLDKIVPGYYHLRDVTTGNVLNRTCCTDNDLSHNMMEKLMYDSLALWAEQYMIDGFRFDIMSYATVDQMLEARDIVQAIDPDNYFYGEGWFQGHLDSATQANQDNLAGTEIATFNDRIREGIRTGAIFNEDGNPQEQDVVKSGMAGTLADYVLIASNGNGTSGSSLSRSAYALDPADVVNYVSKHDNETLWDQLQYVIPFGTSLEDRVRIQNIAMGIPLMSQGIPFLQMGGDMIRSKSMDRNTYDAGDWFNLVDFTMTTNNWNVGLPLAEDNGNNWERIVGFSSNPLAATMSSDIMFANSVFNDFLKIRSDSKLFRLTTSEDIIARVGFHNLGDRQTHGLIVMSIDDGLGVPDVDPNYDALVVMVNATDTEQSHTIVTAGGFELHPIQVNSSADTVVQGSSFAGNVDGETGAVIDGTFTVPAKTMAIFVKPQGEAQGDGLSAFATAGAPDVVPYGDTAVFLRGSMNDWGESNQFTYQGGGVYDVAIALTGGTAYDFKVASSDWSTVDFGNNDAAVVEGEDKQLARGEGNLSITPGSDATYLFSLDAFEPEAPVLNVVNEEPFVGTPVFLRGAMNDWGEGNELEYQGGRIYQAAIDITAGSYEFKVASSDWSTVDYGAENGDEAVVELGVEEALFVAGPNMSIEIAEDDTYLFIFDMINLDPTLGVFKQEFLGGTPSFVRGPNEDWGTTNALTYNGDGTYSVDVALTAIDHQFKVASDDWATVNMGAVSGDEADVFLGVPDLLIQDSQDNFRLSIAADGTYRFLVSIPTSKGPSVTVTEQP